MSDSGESFDENLNNILNDYDTDSEDDEFIGQMIDFDNEENDFNYNDIALHNNEQLVLTDSDETESNTTDSSENGLTESDEENKNIVEEGSLCKHYKRRCKLVCTHCDKAWNCRLCHDDEVFDHQLDR